MTDWRYQFEADPEADADDKKWRRWKAQGYPMVQSRRPGALRLILGLLGAFLLVSYVLVRATG